MNSMAKQCVLNKNARELRKSSFRIVLLTALFRRRVPNSFGQNLSGFRKPEKSIHKSKWNSL
ncbi:MAG: hypothetical protein B6D41_16820 [Chloroflexi bacterium UTCFX4]|nr:MAG: hypothetical protein B6D41_16820 [Chloroflexi bacterium UTCFX4]